MAPGPFYLPGGEALVKTIGGEKKFVTDADECCCPESGCLTDVEAAVVCPGPYFAIIGTGACLLQDCDGLYTFNTVGSPVITARYWGVGPNPHCNAIIFCAHGADAWWWRLVVSVLGGYACEWYRPALAMSDCPDGLYLPGRPAGDPPTGWVRCTACAAIVTVYS